MYKFDANRNMYDVFRMLATIQVVVGHVNKHIAALSLPTMAERILSSFPGVPIFFVMAGFFACQSLDRQSVGTFLKRRFVRLIPWLITVQLLQIVIVACTEGVEKNWAMSVGDVAKWILLLQAPPILRSFGGGGVHQWRTLDHSRRNSVLLFNCGSVAMA